MTIAMTTNKSNWTGEECTVLITDSVKGIFTIGMEGYTFQLTRIPIEMYKVICLEEPSWKWLGQRFGNQVSFFGSGISREANSAYTAFAQLAWSII